MKRRENKQTSLDFTCKMADQRTANQFTGTGDDVLTYQPID